ncbi:MAG: hypothetical protein H7316_20375 [Tardiphaga sp.]|uniref:hypothetical protein n=2 Tax=Tardiphaga TaxID=1395974 RepID=UPI0019886B64|nr:hypothetical protein [Tardiphaga sp.]MBC7586103.1 hypothetical protein [Tardiphaga sp.]
MSGAGFFMEVSMRAPRTTAAKTAARKVTSAKKATPAKRGTAARLDTAAPDSATLVERVAQAVDRELAEIEAIVAKMTGKSRPTEAERRARTLASLARTLSEVRRLRAADETQKPDDVERPGDLEELRQRLSQRLAQMVEAGDAPPVDGVADAPRDRTA